MLKKYLWSRRVLLTAYLGQLALMTGVLSLFLSDMTGMWYCVLLSLFLFFIYLIYDYLRFRDKTRRLADMEKRLSLYAHDAPFPATHTEQQYQQLMGELYELFDRARQQLISEQDEREEYFTMWLHQIKTPIFALRLALEREEHPNPVYAQELFKIERYVEMALQFVKAGDLASDLLIREYPLYDIVAASVKKYSTLFIYKGLRAELKDVGGSVLTDSKWLGFILEQLISNAIKYTPSGSVQITFENGVLAVQDTGVGIRQEDLPRLFEKGYTGYNGRLDKRASGIGLYMAKRVADALGIVITITSAPGRGARAELRFPDKAQLIE